MIEHRRGQLREACATYERAIRISTSAGDLAGLAAAYGNLGQARADLGEIKAAAAAIQFSITLNADLGRTTEIARAKYQLGILLRSMGDFARAGTVFSEARLSLLGLTLAEEAGLAGLELAEVHLALGESERAKAFIEDVLEEFRRANLNQRAIEALAYLREVIATRKGQEAVRRVRTYIKELRRNPQQLFVPLPAD
jgi:tetratricopeptide (TPR) repeat protein